MSGPVRGDFSGGFLWLFPHGAAGAGVDAGDGGAESGTGGGGAGRDGEDDGGDGRGGGGRGGRGIRSGRSVAGLIPFVGQWLMFTMVEYSGNDRGGNDGGFNTVRGSVRVLFQFSKHQTSRVMFSGSLPLSVISIFVLAV